MSETPVPCALYGVTPEPAAQFRFTSNRIASAAKTSNSTGLSEQLVASPHRQSDTESREATPMQPILKLDESAHSKVLGELLAGSPSVRRALLALAVDPALQLGVLRGGLEFWPDDVPTGSQRAERRLG